MVTYAIGVDFAEGIFMQVKSCNNTFQQADKLGMFELKNSNTRTECQCHLGSLNLNFFDYQEKLNYKLYMKKSPSKLVQYI